MQLRWRHHARVSASGSVDAQGHLTTDWSGNSIAGVVSADGNRIDWDNGTWWVR